MKKYLIKFLALIIGLIVFSFIPDEEWTTGVFVFYGICIMLTSVIAHCIYKKYYWRAVLFTIIVSPIIFTTGSIIVSITHFYSISMEILARNLPDIIMWSPIAFIRGFLYTFPVAFPVSMIIGDIFKWFRARKEIK